MPDTDDQIFEGIDLLDPTKIVPEELCPVRLVGTLTLDRNPANFFAETEQVAFCAGHFVPGIERHRRSAAARADCSRTSTRRSPGSAVRTSTRSRSTGPRRR